MSPRTSPCNWTPTIPTATGLCCTDINDPTQVTAHDIAVQVATNMIWALTGRQYGTCSITIRPCKPKNCDPITLSQLIYWDSRAYLTFGQPNLGVLNFFPTLMDGQVFNVSCGCPSGCCKCKSDCEILLPGPVASITNVTVDGTTLDPSNYIVYDDSILSFSNNTVVFPSNNATCPGCQDYNKVAGEVGTWTVTYNIGIPVPAEANLAAGLYALEIFKALVNDKSCGLPQRVQQTARQGISTQYFNPTVLANEGLTGIPVVDTILRELNPYKLASPPRVWVPGLKNANARVQTSP